MFNFETLVRFGDLTLSNLLDEYDQAMEEWVTFVRHDPDWEKDLAAVHAKRAAIHARVDSTWQAYKQVADAMHARW